MIETSVCVRGFVGNVCERRRVVAVSQFSRELNGGAVMRSATVGTYRRQAGTVSVH